MFVLWWWYMFLYVFLFFVFFKQKTAYEMRISDWSSDVCSSDLLVGVIIVLLFFFIVGLGLVVGAELNAALAETPEGDLKESPDTETQIGRASCRERVCQYV